MAVLRRNRLRALAMLPLLALMGGCNLVVMNPSGDVAAQQSDLIVVSTLLMLIIIVPVIAATFWFAYRYRASNAQAKYDPDWHHSTGLEVLIWTAPLMIIIALGAVTWISTHLLDPYRPLGRIAPGQPVTPETQTLKVEVVALDWKWMFFYPDYGIATINELAAPVDMPIEFKLTSAAQMTAFYVPALAGMIYTMPGMETTLHAVINEDGVYDGLASHYNGPGFSRMRFKFHGLDQAGFDGWVQKVKAQGEPLTRESYLEVEKPSEGNPPRYFNLVEPGLYQAILGMCVEPGKMCMQEMMAIDAQGGVAENHEANRERLVHDRTGSHEGFGYGSHYGGGGHGGSEAPGATTPASGRESRSQEQPEGMTPDENGPAPAPGENIQDGHAGHGAEGTAPGAPGAPPPAESGSAAPAQLNQQ